MRLWAPCGVQPAQLNHPTSRGGPTHNYRSGRTSIWSKGAGSKKAALAMAYKLLDAAQERWRRFNGHELVSDVLDGAKFKDGINVTDDETTTNERVAA